MRAILSCGKGVHRKVTFERGEHMGLADIWVKNITGRVNAMCRCPEVTVSGIVEEQERGLFNWSIKSEEKRVRSEH